MILSKTTTYALRIIIHIAGDENAKYSAVALHNSLGIKQQYLRRLLTELAAMNFIVSHRGREGGYTIARPATSITIAEVIEKFEGAEMFTSCILGVDDCRQQPRCGMHAIWAKAREGMMLSFERTTLADVNSDFV